MMAIGTGLLSKGIVNNMGIGDPDFEKTDQDAFAQARDDQAPTKTMAQEYYEQTKKEGENKHAIGNAKPKQSGYVNTYT
jgi:hypothetical protein